MEPQGGEDQLQLVWGTGGTAGCLCPAAVAAGTAPASLFPLHALEQEVLHRAGLQLAGGVGGGGGGGDRRRERQMKNRESAARSRQRRHVYLSELEKEVRLLRAENEELRKLCEELKEAAAEASPAPVKKQAPGHQLQRTSSAPF